MFSALAAATAPRRRGLPSTSPPPALRSEERRVGKECRSRCDWSSDVCSSDLLDRAFDVVLRHVLRLGGSHGPAQTRVTLDVATASFEIGRASCRERV